MGFGLLFAGLCRVGHGFESTVFGFAGRCARALKIAVIGESESCLHGSKTRENVFPQTH